MNEIMTKTYNLIDELDNSNIINNITKLKAKILNNQEIQSLLEKSKTTDDKYILLDIKKKLYSFDIYKEYMHYYNELNLIIIDINTRLKQLTNINNCHK